MRERQSTEGLSRHRLVKRMLCLKTDVPGQQEAGIFGALGNIYSFIFQGSIYVLHLELECLDS